MKVSVIVPVYNAAKYLDQCLKSLIDQTLEDMEIICIDNCSSDDSRNIILQYEGLDKRIRHIFNDTNIGQGASLNKALEACTGEYIAECDSDDWVASNMYERLYNIASLHDADVAQCAWYDCYGDKREPRQLTTKIYCGNPMNDLQGLDLLQFLGFQPHIMSAVYKRSFLDSNGIRYREGTNFEDTCLTFKLRTTGNPYVIIPDCLYFYRRDNEQSGAHTIHDPFGICEQYEEINRWNESHNLGLDVFIGTMRYYSYRWASTLILDTDTQAQQEFTAKCAEDFAKDFCMPGLFLTEEDWKNYQNVRKLAPLS